MKKFRIFLKELVNMVLNVFVPVLSVVAAAAELLHLPAPVIKFIKNLEYWFFYAAGTKGAIDEILNKVEDAFEDEKITFEEVVEIGKSGKEFIDKVTNDIKTK